MSLPLAGPSPLQSARGRGRGNRPGATARCRGSPATGRPGAGGGELRHDAARHGGSRFEILPGLAVLVFGEEVPVPGPQRAGARLAEGREPLRVAVALHAERLDGGGPAAVGPSDQPAVAAPGDGWSVRERLEAWRADPDSGAGRIGSACGGGRVNDPRGG